MLAKALKRCENGVPQDYSEAVRWFHLAAEQGDALAQYNLAIMHGNGIGLEQSFILAHMWMNISGQNGDEEVIQLVELIQEMTSFLEIITARRKAVVVLESGYQNCD